jgi:tetratricopeptide (TPR) repeat protein
MLVGGAALLPGALHAEPVARTAPVAGSIIRTRSGETAVLVPSPTVRRAEVLQQLKAGDVLRTGGVGALAIVFADQTQIRLGPNSVLVVREVRAGQPSALELQRGRVWGRSPSGKTRLSVETPSATAAIRGTEWAIVADEAATTLQVFEGEIAFANAAGGLTVSGGEAATARPGQAPTRVVLVNRVGREQMLYYLSRDEGLEVLADSSRWRGVYAAWFAAAAAAEAPPAPALDEADPDSWAGSAFLLAWQGDLDAAMRRADAGLARHPASSALHEVKARIALLEGDGALAEQTVAAWLERHPDDGAAYAMRAEIAFAYLGEPYAALDDAERAVRLDGARASSFATLADIRLERDATREALRAIDRAIALAPDDAGLHARRAAILLRANRVRAARRAIERAQQLDPSLSIVRAALARYYVQTGDGDSALDELLAASAGNPAYAPPLIDLAEAYYRAGDDAAAQQQLDAADRLDAANPQTPLARTAIALDRYAADEAIGAAGEAMRRYRARGGVYSSLSENRATGSYVSEAFRFLGLEGWGRYYGDRVFDSFTPSAYFDQALNKTASPFIQAPREFSPASVYRPLDPQAGIDLDSVSSFVQGLMLDPLSVTASERVPQFSNERFLEASLGFEGFDFENVRHLGVTASVDGILHTPVPFGFSVEGTFAREELVNPSPNGTFRNSPEQVSGYFGSEITADDGLVAWGAYERRDRHDTSVSNDGFFDTLFSTESERRRIQAFGFYSHSFGARNLLSLGGGIGDARSVAVNRSTPQVPFPVTDVLSFDSRDRFTLLSAAYARGIGRVDLKAGVELVESSFRVDQSEDAVFDDGFVLPLDRRIGEPARAGQDQAYLDVRFWPRGAWQFQAHVAVVDGRDERLNAVTLGTTIDARIGAAWEPASGHWLRLALGRNTPRQVPFTLAPSTTLGLRENLLPSFFELLTPTDLPGPVESVIARWDAEWSAHAFTALEYQHQRFGHFPISSPDGQLQIRADRARIDRLAGSFNLWATGNLGIAVNGALTRGRTDQPLPTTGNRLPFLPTRTGQVTLVWMMPAPMRLSAQLTGNYIGPQYSFLGAQLHDYAIVNASLGWEPGDKRLELRAEVFNLFDSDFRVSDAAGGRGRGLSGSMLVRF